MIRNKNIKLGHQAPKGYIINNFNSIELKGDFAYCKSHDFIYQPDFESKKLYNAQPCYYTDIRYIDSFNNFYKSTYLYNKRKKEISLKSCIRRTLKCKNIPLGTIIDFKKSWYFRNKNIDNSFLFKIKKENKFDPEYQINDPTYFNNFTTCEFSKKLTDALRANGFIVKVHNSNFLSNMFNTAILYTGGKDFIDTEIKGEIAIAYGYGKKIGYSSYNDDFMGYSDGMENILYDHYGYFDKWSRCEHIKKTFSIEKIINILKTDKPIEDNE